MPNFNIRTPYTCVSLDMLYMRCSSRLDISVWSFDSSLQPNPELTVAKGQSLTLLHRSKNCTPCEILVMFVPTRTPNAP